MRELGNRFRVGTRGAGSAGTSTNTAGRGRLACAAALSVALVVACSGPERPGPNVQDVPGGFFFDANASQARNVFLDVPEIDQSGWMAMRGDDHSTIMITVYEGAMGEAEVRAARDEHVRRYGRKGGYEYGEVQQIEIDDRPAWGWEIRQYYKGDLASLDWTTVVPYEDATYAVEFHAGIDEHMDWNLMRQTVGSFRAD